MTFPRGHVFLHHACGKGAIRVREPIAHGDPIHGRHFEHLDGRPAVDGDRMLCDSCGEPFQFHASSVEMTTPNHAATSTQEHQ